MGVAGDGQVHPAEPEVLRQVQHMPVSIRCGAGEEALQASTIRRITAGFGGAIQELPLWQIHQARTRGRPREIQGISRVPGETLQGVLYLGNLSNEASREGGVLDQPDGFTANQDGRVEGHGGGQEHLVSPYTTASKPTKAKVEDPCERGKRSSAVA